VTSQRERTGLGLILNRLLNRTSKGPTFTSTLSNAADFVLETA
jgi:hypothetical protein